MKQTWLILRRGWVKKYEEEKKRWIWRVALSSEYKKVSFFPFLLTSSMILYTPLNLSYSHPTQVSIYSIPTPPSGKYSNFHKPQRLSSLWHLLFTISIFFIFCVSLDPETKTLKMAKNLVIFLTLISFLPLLCNSFSSENPSDRKILVLVDDLGIKSSHSIFFKSLQTRGFELDFKLAEDPKLTLKRYGKYLYDGLVLFSPSTKRKFISLWC